MRKIDYSILAQLLRTQLASAREIRDNTTNSDRAHFANGAVNALEYITCQFAARCNVDRADFLNEVRL